MGSKYHARKTVVDNITFDSALEAARYQQLMVLVRTGDIFGLTVHPVFELTPEKIVGIEKISAIKHELDFSYYETPANDEKHNPLIVEDCKGVKTDVWRIKYKLFRCRYPEIHYRVVTRKDM